MLLGAFSHLKGSTSPFYSALVFQSGRGPTISFLHAVPLDRGHSRWQGQSYACRNSLCTWFQQIHTSLFKECLRAEEKDLQADKFFGDGAEEFETET